MRVLLFLLSAFAFLVGGAILSAAESAIHEIEAFLLFLIAATFLSSAAVVEALNRRKKDSSKTEELLLKISNWLDEQAGSIKKACDCIVRESSIPPLPGEERYYLSVAGHIEGPYPIERIREFAKRTAAEDSMILREGTREWQRIGTAQ